MLVMLTSSALGYAQLGFTGSVHARTSTITLDASKGYNGVDVPYREADYNPDAADAFFRARPVATLKRLVQLTQLSGSFIASTIMDKQLDREEAMVEQRSQELLELVSKLGPTFIKVGQALSIRTDLLPAPYVAGLTKLQDAVPPFSGAQGRAIIEKELGIRLDETFSEISLEPVASASIGQVYKGTLRATGEEVAVKVQRPNVLYDVALDLFMMRTLAPVFGRANDMNTDLVGLVDAWGFGFVNELDYNKEAAATTAFAVAMDARGLGSVTSPEVVYDLSSTHVLTTKWVDGERLASSGADDVPRLCGVALNAYLTMLLDTGTLHCDPHPGNLLRTTDGKLCILDFGMCLEVPTDLQLSLLEFISDLSAEAYERVPDDLVNLGFVPADKIDELRSSGLTSAISFMLRSAAQGGGPSAMQKRLVEGNKEKYGAALIAKYGTLDSPEATKERQRLFKEDWQKEMAADAMKYSGDGAAPTSTTADLTQKIEELQQKNSNVFAIPEYFVYMSRAFSTLEGIGLSADADYAILKECFPYLAKRLLSDDSPRARGALRTLLYGSGDELNLSKLQDVTTGLESYTTSTSSVASSQGTSDEGREAAIGQLTDVILAEDGNFVQDLLMREVAVTFDAAARNTLVSAPLRNLPPLPELPEPPALLAPFLAPLGVPLAILRAGAELQQTDARDEQRLHNLKILRDLVGGSGGSTPAATQPQLAGAATGGDAVPRARAPAVGDVSASLETLRGLATGTAERRTALARTGVRFGRTIAATQAERLRQKLDGDAELSELAQRLGTVGAVGLEGATRSLTLLDKGLASPPAREAGGEGAGAAHNK